MFEDDAADTIEERDAVVIRFAGDSGDGMQTVGERFTDSSALMGNDISTLPDFPAEIRAPQGTLPGVSGFQVHFGSTEILTSGDDPDALVAMNPAALKVNLDALPAKGLLVVNTGAFKPDNLKKAGYAENPLDDPALDEKYTVVKIDITQLTLDALADSELKPTERGKCKNFFALGFMYWIYDRPLEYTTSWIESKWAKRPGIIDANLSALKAGYHFGETYELEIPRYTVLRAAVEAGIYRKITGNEAMVLGLIAASECAGRDLVAGSYPITPATSILEGLAAHKNFGVKTVQAEDEIAAVGVAIGASYAGAIGVTSTSGPGLCLKSEAIGLAMITELPLIIINCQRGGPSTGLPTKTEQGDLLQAMFGRNGESPIPVIAAKSPGDCFNVAIEATRIALTYNTPVIVLSEANIAMGSEPWKIPSVSALPDLMIEPLEEGEEYVPYRRDPETLARTAVEPGRPGFEHRLGGLEKNEAGDVSYDPKNHQDMTDLRAAKVAGIAKSIAPTIINGDPEGDVLVFGWGGTYGAITKAVGQLRAEGHKVSSLNVRHLNPLPLDIAEILPRFKKILVPELNLGQMCMLLRARYLVDCIPFSKVEGRPFMVREIREKVLELLND